MAFEYNYHCREKTKELLERRLVLFAHKTLLLKLTKLYRSQSHPYAIFSPKEQKKSYEVELSVVDCVTLLGILREMEVLEETLRLISELEGWIQEVGEEDWNEIEEELERDKVVSENP